MKIMIAFLSALLIIALTWSGATAVCVYGFGIPFVTSAFIGFGVTFASYAITVWAMR